MPNQPNTSVFFLHGKIYSCITMFTMSCRVNFIGKIWVMFMERLKQIYIFSLVSIQHQHDKTNRED